ncbi:flagellar FlbD family protein [Bacillus massilinigeriensis]|uniref:flagellar FlbD family protein n=1 Tax=Bacillus mediterraneensis TaxID=1805474 RepID=UPI0008F90E6A|nr:flagellar FlbD family protein [Bacillus mediterraneensis]
MIRLTKLNGKQFGLNAIFIETVESFPDTTITLTNGHKYIVSETVDEVFALIAEFTKSVGLIGTNMLGEMKDEE